MELREFDRGTELDQREGNLIRVSEEFESSEFELGWLTTVLAVYEYMSFAKLWQEKGCSSQAETWQVKNILIKYFDWQVKCAVFVVSMAT